MANHVIADDVLHSTAAESYFTHADRRVLIGLRATLGMLGLPEPEYARRRKPGPTPARSVKAAFLADHPQGLSTDLAQRRPNASADVIAAAKQRSPFA